MFYTKAQVERIAELTFRTGQRDAAAFEELYRTLQPFIAQYTYARTHHSELIDDTVQNVMLAIWKYAGGFNPEKNVMGWIKKIAENTLNQMWKKAQNEIPYDFDDPVSQIAFHKKKFQNDFQKDLAVESLLEGLDEELKEIFILKFYKYRNCEIAKLKGVSVRRVNYLYRLSRQALLKRLKH